MVGVGDFHASHSVLPLYIACAVVRGHGRGGTQLGYPTANLRPDDFACCRDCLPDGVYYGFATVNDGPVLPMVMSVGYNPHFKDVNRTWEVHILHSFPSDFYGATVSILVTGFIREQTSFSSLAELISAIEADIGFARRSLGPAPTSLRSLGKHSPHSHM